MECQRVLSEVRPLEFACMPLLLRILTAIMRKVIQLMKHINICTTVITFYEYSIVACGQYSHHQYGLAIE